MRRQTEFTNRIPDNASKVKCISVEGDKNDYGGYKSDKYADTFTIGNIYNIVKVTKSFVPMVKDDHNYLRMINYKNFIYLDSDNNILTKDVTPFVYHTEEPVIELSDEDQVIISEYLKQRKEIATKIYLESIKGVFDKIDIMNNNLDITNNDLTADDTMEMLANNSIILATKFLERLEAWDESYKECN